MEEFSEDDDDDDLSDLSGIYQIYLSLMLSIDIVTFASKSWKQLYKFAFYLLGWARLVYYEILIIVI